MANDHQILSHTLNMVIFYFVWNNGEHLYIVTCWTFIHDMGFTERNSPAGIIRCIAAILSPFGPSCRSGQDARHGVALPYFIPAGQYRSTMNISLSCTDNFIFYIEVRAYFKTFWINF